jgi:hypothetical protein
MRDSSLLAMIVLLGALQERKLTVKAEGEDRIGVFRPGESKPIVVLNSKADFRPYVHPILAPDGLGELTEFSPSHHRHQTGLYWGFTNVNGRDYFHHPGDGYFKRQSARVLAATGPSVRWEIVYHLLAEDGKAVLAERQTWTMRDGGDHYVLDLSWEGRGLTDVTVGRYDYGGLFLRMPWKDGIRGAAVNAEGLANEKAEGRRSAWVDVAMRVEGRKDPGHIVVMDHPSNPGHPQPWRVDGQLGVGPCQARLGDWKIGRDKAVTFRHRFLVYTGEAKPDLVKKSWAEFAKGAETK